MISLANHWYMAGVISLLLAATQKVDTNKHKVAHKHHHESSWVITSHHMIDTMNELSFIYKIGGNIKCELLHMITLIVKFRVTSSIECACIIMQDCNLLQTQKYQRHTLIQ